MGGKGRRRREKNYKAAHVVHTRLPPPPDRSQVDVLPSKLRQIMSFTSHLLDGSAKSSKSPEDKRKLGGGDAANKFPPEDAIASGATLDEGDHGNLLTIQHSDDSDEIVRGSKDEKRNKKRKRKQANDLRFDTSMEKTKSSEKRRERKKKYLEAKKKKRQKSEKEDNLDFPGHEQIKFGDIVQAPPKLVDIPKVRKNNVAEASRERIRLRAIEEYRKRKEWTSRPGLKLPSVTATQSF